MLKNLSWYIAVVLVGLLLLLQFVFPLPQKYLVISAFVAFGVAMFIIIKATDYMVDSITAYAHKWRMPSFLVGFVIISTATSFPDLSAGFFAALGGHGDLILGDVVSAVMVDLVLLTAISALILKKIPTGKEEFSGRVVWGLVGLAFLPLVFGRDGYFSRLEGGILLGVFAVYLIIMVIKEVRIAHIAKSIPFRKIWQEMVVFAFALAAILLAAQQVVASATFIAWTFRVPPFIVGLFLVALGTSMPEITFQIKMARKGAVDIGFGNSLGSLIVNTLLVTGLTALVRPFDFPLAGFLFSYVYMMAAVVLVVFLFKKRFLTLRHGFMLLGLFVLFFVVNLIVGVVV